MRIAVNLRVFRPEMVGGIENYVRAVVGGIARDQTGDGNQLTIFCPDVSVASIREFAPSATYRTVPWHACGLSIAKELDPSAYDVLLCPQFGLDPLSPGLPSVAMIADLAHRAAPATFDAPGLVVRERLVADTLQSATAVLTLSNHAREAVIAAYDFDPDRVFVTPCDADPVFRTPASPEHRGAVRALGLPARYLVYPAHFYSHKNHPLLLQALRLLAGAGRDVDLVLTGEPSTGADRVRAHITDLGLDDRVRLLGYLPQPVLVEVMRGAVALVFPTLFEGFGIPPLEAFHLGIPVVASSVAGNAEVIGDAAEIVDPRDPPSIARGIERVLADTQLRAELVARGRARSSLFSWSRTVEHVLEALRFATGAAAEHEPRAQVTEPRRVSIVTPALEPSRDLKRTIDSVLGQEYPYIDYAVVAPVEDARFAELRAHYAGRVRWLSVNGECDRADAVRHGFRSPCGQLSDDDLFAVLDPGVRCLPDMAWRAIALVQNAPAGSAGGRAAPAGGRAGSAGEAAPAGSADGLERMPVFTTRGTFARSQLSAGGGAERGTPLAGANLDGECGQSQTAALRGPDG
ncbi:MAG TPA: glycosyltransferase [Solirubrobacteraceae bacterium]|nr:glycosyltransferase [Solirubrobacteraceae bacterium]